ncbi:hypothetical protein CLOM_g11895 [Closterium sp. NIES-68]|nr:hypothetical protein CLOM_g11895 [Closterium sp. NIES-68]
MEGCGRVVEHVPCPGRGNWVHLRYQLFTVLLLRLVPTLLGLLLQLRLLSLPGREAVVTRVQLSQLPLHYSKSQVFTAGT